MAQFDNCLAERGTDMRQVKFLVSGWNVLPNGSYHRFRALCVFEQAEICLPLATMRDDDTIAVKVNNIEVVWNSDQDAICKAPNASELVAIGRS